MNIINSLKWSAFTEVLSKILPPIFYIINARILTPDDFGIVATSAMIIALSNILWEAGLAKKLIQMDGVNGFKSACNIVFYSNVMISIIVFLILYLCSDYLAEFFQREEISDVIKVTGFSIIFGAFSSVQTALFQKFFKYKKLFIARLSGGILPGLVSVTFAYLGYGYWALVFGSVASVFIQAVVLWYVSEWRPTLSYDLSLAKEMFSFSKWVMLSALLSWFFAWGDIFVISYYFNLHEVGLYRTGNYFVATVIGLIATPVVPVMYSYFSSMRLSSEGLSRSLLLASKAISFFVLPISVAIFLFQIPLSSLLFGEKWVGIGNIIGILALMHGVSWIIGLNNEAYTAVGRPDLETKILTINIIVYAIVYWLVAKISFDMFLLARFALAVFSIFVHVVVSKKVLNIGIRENFYNISSILFSLIMVFIFNYLFFPIINTVLLMALSAAFSLVIYLFCVFLFDRFFFNELIKVVKNRGSKVD